ncbi:hypothetical protein, partial [Salmonella enterica]|uniref:hypothetical protein n=1 Tax=Salmonella enterica TaxID=28901 RepID=UPI001C60ABC0
LPSSARAARPCVFPSSAFRLFGWLLLPSSPSPFLFFFSLFSSPPFSSFPSFSLFFPFFLPSSLLFPPSFPLFSPFPFFLPFLFSPSSSSSSFFFFSLFFLLLLPPPLSPFSSFFLFFFSLPSLYFFFCVDLLLFVRAVRYEGVGGGEVHMRSSHNKYGIVCR